MLGGPPGGGEWAAGLEKGGVEWGALPGGEGYLEGREAGVLARGWYLCVSDRVENARV